MTSPAKSQNVPSDGRVPAWGLEAEGELIDVASVHEDAKSKNISANETLNLLALEWSLYSNSLNNDIVGQDKANAVSKTRNALGRGSADIDHTDWLKSQLLDRRGLYDTARGTSVNYAFRWHWLGDFAARLPSWPLRRESQSRSACQREGPTLVGLEAAS